MSSLRSTVRRWSAAAAFASLVWTSAVLPAHAASVTRTIPTTLVGAGPVTTSNLSKDTDTGSFTGSLSTSLSMAWTETGAINIGWEPDNVRQGRALDPTYAFDPNTGYLTVTANATVTGTVHTVNGDVAVSMPVNVSMAGTCSPNPDGSYPDCTVTAAEESFEPCPGLLGSSFCPLSPLITLKPVAVVSIGALGSTTTRDAVLGGSPVVPPSTLHPTVATQVDALTVPCRVQSGSDLSYSLSTVTAGRTFNVQFALTMTLEVSAPIGVPIPVPPVVIFPYVAVSTVTIQTGQSTTPTLTGTGGSVAMGAIQANNGAPTLAAAASWSGSEGTPIAFSATASGPCAAGGTYVWSFSDGTTEYGPTPSKRFSDSGTFTGQVVFTDATGLSDTRSFTVTVANVAPTVAVTPQAATISWGRDLTLSAQAVDPGSADQPTLTYRWTFADGTPVSTGGPVVTHRWATPGEYAVTLQVCDKDGGCSGKAILVTVDKRATTTSYTGANAAVHADTATLSASVVDEFGQAVPGGAVAFSIAGTSVGSATTGANGVASRVQTVTQPAGMYDVTATYGGSSLYKASASATGSFAVTTMGSRLTYTGTLTAKPNAILPVSVLLTDDLGRPLAGRAVTIAVGTQSVVVTTDAQGVGLGSIALKQKPGNYPVTATWAGDTDRYKPAGWSGTFKLNTK